MAESNSDSAQIVREQSESVAATNLKTLGDGPAFYTVMQYSNATTNQQQVNQLSLSILAKSAELIIETKPVHGGADIAALQQLMKGAQTTPPVTP